MGDEGLYLLEKVELPGLPVRQKLRITPRLVVAHARLIDELDAAQKFNVHVAFVAGQEEAHRIAVPGHNPLAILVERDHRVVHCLLDRHAAAKAGASAPSAMNHFAFGSMP